MYCVVLVEGLGGITLVSLEGSLLARVEWEGRGGGEGGTAFLSGCIKASN